MIGFLVVSGLILLVVIGLLLVPIIKAPSDRPRYLTVLATGAGLPVLVIGLYLTIGNWQLGPTTSGSPSATVTPTSETRPESVEAMVGDLAARLQTQGGTAEEWQMLGRSYMVMGRFADASTAFAAALAESASGDPELVGQYAESLVLSVEGSLEGEAGQLFEQVLAAQPQEPRALWYGGIAAFQRGDNALAISRWQQLLQQDPPDELREVLLARIADAGGAAQGGNAQAVVQGSSSSNDAMIRVSVSADENMLKNIGPQTPLFVLARSKLPGPPLAVKRMRVADLPFEVTLSSEDAMIPGREISFADATEIVARVALSGAPQATSGDLFGQVALPTDDPGDTVTIIINQRVQ